MRNDVAHLPNFCRDQMREMVCHSAAVGRLLVVEKLGQTMTSLIFEQFMNAARAGR